MCTLNISFFSSCLKIRLLFFPSPPKLVIIQSFSHTVFNKSLGRLPDLCPILNHDKFPADGSVRSYPHRAWFKTRYCPDLFTGPPPCERLWEGPQDHMLFSNNYKWKPSSTKHFLQNLQLCFCPLSIFLLCCFVLIFKAYVSLTAVFKKLFLLSGVAMSTTAKIKTRARETIILCLPLKIFIKIAFKAMLVKTLPKISKRDEESKNFLRITENLGK